MAKEPTITVRENISSDLRTHTATIILNNMLPSLTVTRIDNTTGDKRIFQTENEAWEDNEMEFGHEYTISVTDSLDRTVSKTFVFGDSAFDIDATVVSFRYPAPAASTIAGGDPKRGGFIKVGDTVRVLKNIYKKSEGQIDFVIREVTSAGPGSWRVPSFTDYIDAAGEKWYECYVPHIGRYDLGIRYNNVDIALYTTMVEDNTTVNLYVACDYLAYKGGIRPELNTLSKSNWDNGAPFQNTNADSWLMRHSFYRQNQDDTAPYDCYVYTKGGNEVAIFGWPERATKATDTDVKRTTYYKADYTQFNDYNLDESYNFIPTLSGNTTRQHYEAMSYSDDGRAAADASNLVITGYAYDNSTVTLRYTGTDGNITAGRGCVVVMENGAKLFPVVVDGSTLKAYSDYDIYPGEISPSVMFELLRRAVVYRTMFVPVIYKPFYTELTAVTWNNQYLDVPGDDLGESVPERQNFPLSYGVTGNVYNGITFGNHFYPREGNEGPYETYFNFPTSDAFYNALNGIGTTSSDYLQRKKSFSITRYNTTEEDEDVDTMIYKITEGIPSSFPAGALTERYDGGVDQEVITDSCSMTNNFYTDIKIKCEKKDKGRTGNCWAFTEEDKTPDTTEWVVTGEEFFSHNSFLSVQDGATTAYYGYYNENAKYDKKGTSLVVMSTPLLGRGYIYPLTNEKGEVKLTISDSGTMYDNGVSLAYKFVPITERITATYVESVFLNGTRLNLGTSTEPGTLFGGSYKTIIGKYTKPDDGSRNKMVVYKLYPIDSLPLLFPADVYGVSLYMTAPSPLAFSKYEVSTFINVSSNVKFQILNPSGCDWVSLDASEGVERWGEDSLEHDATNLNVKLALKEYSDTGNTPRRCDLILRCVEPGLVEGGDDPRVKKPVDVPIVILQSPTEAPPEPEPSGDTSTNATEDAEGGD